MPVAKAVARVACANGIGRSILDLAAQLSDARAQTRITSKRGRLRIWEISRTRSHPMRNGGKGRPTALCLVLHVSAVKRMTYGELSVPGSAPLECVDPNIFYEIVSGHTGTLGCKCSGDLYSSTETHTISSVTGPRLGLHIHPTIRAESQVIRIWKSFDMMWLPIEGVHVLKNLEWFILFCM